MKPSKRSQKAETQTQSQTQPNQTNQASESKHVPWKENQQKQTEPNQTQTQTKPKPKPKPKPSHTKPAQTLGDPFDEVPQMGSDATHVLRYAQTRGVQTRGWTPSLLRFPLGKGAQKATETHTNTQRQMMCLSKLNKPKQTRAFITAHVTNLRSNWGTLENQAVSHGRKIRLHKVSPLD